MFSAVGKAMRLARAFWDPQVGSQPIYQPRYFYHLVSHRISMVVFGSDKQRFLPSAVSEKWGQFLQYTFLRLTHFNKGPLSLGWTRIVDGAGRRHEKTTFKSVSRRDVKKDKAKIRFQPLNGRRKSKGMRDWRSPQIISVAHPGGGPMPSPLLEKKIKTFYFIFLLFFSHFKIKWPKCDEKIIFGGRWFWSRPRVPPIKKILSMPLHTGEPMADIRRPLTKIICRLGPPYISQPGTIL